MTDRRHRRLAKGLCTRCGKKNPRDTWLCEDCKDKHNAWAKKRRRRNRSEGKCITCGKAHSGATAHCENCLERARAYGITRRERSRVDGTCSRCRKTPVESRGLCDPCNERRRSLYKRGARAEWRKNNPLKSLMTAKRCYSKRRNLIFNLTRDYLQRLWEAQEGRCHWLGIELDLSLPKNHPRKATLERLNPSQGYETGNVVWASSFANRGRVDFPADEFRIFLERFIEAPQRLTEEDLWTLKRSEEDT